MKLRINKSLLISNIDVKKNNISYVLSLIRSHRWYQCSGQNHWVEVERQGSGPSSATNTFFLNPGRFESNILLIQALKK